MELTEFLDKNIIRTSLSADNKLDAIKKMSNLLMENGCTGKIGVFSGNDNEGYKYAVCEKDGDLKQFVKDMNTALNGRGGGKPFFAQGSVNCKWEEIQNFFKA